MVDGPTTWKLPDLVIFDGDWEAYVAVLYGHYLTDLVTRELVWLGMPVLVPRHPEEEGKGAAFWHCTSEYDKVVGDRVPDLRRCERIRWIRALLEAPIAEVRVWEEAARGRDPRMVIATPDFDYLVVVRRTKARMVLTTAFCAGSDWRRDRYRKEYDEAVRTGKAITS